ncbi:hypothetical protein lerEdw1_016100 [Lerista edwardsae]|nr:hypothetical protein lerEdw1_016100 [Lerista edwardsae]
MRVGRGLAQCRLRVPTIGADGSPSDSQEQPSSPQKQGVKARSKSTEEIQPAKKVVGDLLLLLLEVQVKNPMVKPCHLNPLSLEPPSYNDLTSNRAFHTPQKSLPSQMDDVESKGSCPVSEPNTTQQQQT